MRVTTNPKKKLNPLFEIIQIAVINSFLIEQNEDFESFDEELIIPIPKESYSEKFETYGDSILYDTKELAGIAGMFNEIKKRNGIVIYSNDLGQQTRGIDCIGKSNGNYLICEAKGTTLEHSTVSQHLKKTKTKGRQMSWDWIWSSLVDFAEDSRNSKAFLEIYQNVITFDKVERLVFISRLKKIKNKYLIQSTQLYLEGDFNHLSDINSFKAQGKLNNWLNEILNTEG